ncbi:MAG: amidohydrolase family protein [Gemmatimonadaceae bacterium]|nr:amidohydrolase family protein [Gemmatimonadaceae bacterium]
MSGPVRWHARWVLPIAGPPIADGTVVTAGDRILWVGPRAEAPHGAPGGDARDEDLGDAILTPGLVNAHTHLDLTLMRGGLEDLDFFAWIRTLTRAKRQLLTAADFRDSALLGVAEGLAAGITTFGDTADNDAPFEALRALGARGIAFREVFGPDPAECDRSMADLAAAVEARRAHATPLVRVGVSPHAPYSVSDALFAAVAAYAAREGLPVAVHAAESAAEDDLVQRGTGPFADFLRARGIAVEARAAGPIALLEAAGLLRAGTLLIHCVRASGADVQRVVAAGCGVAHCPASNAKLGHGTAPLAAFLAAGARVGLGSDSMASNDAMDLLAEARLAVFAQRAAAGRADLLPAAEALALATRGGARALGLEAEVGTLEPGKQADLVAWRATATGGPVGHPAAALVFAGAGMRAHRVLVAGVERARDGVVAGLDPAVPGRVRDAARRMAEWRGQRTAG